MLMKWQKECTLAEKKSRERQTLSGTPSLGYQKVTCRAKFASLQRAQIVSRYRGKDGGLTFRGAAFDEKSGKLGQFSVWE